MPLFLTCYDYGTGGIWLYVEADSPKQILETYKHLTVFETPPAWWTEELEARTRKKVSTDPFWRDYLDRFKR